MVSFNILAGAARIREHIDRGIWNDSVHPRWSGLPRSLLGLGGNRLELWKTKEFGELLKLTVIPTPIPPKPVFQVALFYHNLDSGQCYWDNNDGQDYFVQTI